MYNSSRRRTVRRDWQRAWSDNVFVNAWWSSTPSRNGKIVTFCEEPRAAYDRVGLTSFFAHRNAHKLLVARQEWYAENDVELHVGDRASSIDRRHESCGLTAEWKLRMTACVGPLDRFPFVPTVPGIDKQGVFVYRTIEDLQHIIEYAGRSKRWRDHRRRNCWDWKQPRPRTIWAWKLTLSSCSSLNAAPSGRCGFAHPGKKNRRTRRAGAFGKIDQGSSWQRLRRAIEFNNGETLDVDMIIVSAGIRPRDDLAKQSGLDVGAARRHYRKRPNWKHLISTSTALVNVHCTAG